MITPQFHLQLQCKYEFFHVNFTSFHYTGRYMNSINWPRSQRVASSFRKWPTYEDVFIFDERFQDLISDYNQVLHENIVLRLRPDCGGFLTDIMKKNLSTFVFSKRWYKVWFFKRTRLLRFDSRHDPVFGSNHSFLFSYEELTWLDKQAMNDILEPFIFGAKLSAGLIQKITWQKKNKETSLLARTVTIENFAWTLNAY